MVDNVSKALVEVDGKLSENELQKATSYIPTACEKKIVDALLDPANRYKTVTDLCKIAGVSRDIYYDCFKKTDFQEYYKYISIMMVKQAVAPMINTFVKEGLRGSYQHGKAILEMADVYHEGGLVQTQGASTINIMVMPQPDKPRELQVVEVINKLEP